MADLYGTGEHHNKKTTAYVNTGLAVVEKRCVILVAEPNLVGPASVATTAIFGIAMWGAAADLPVTVVQSGDVLCEAGAVIAMNAELATNANGKLVTAVATNHVVGRALTSAAADADIFLAEIYESGWKLP